MLHKEEARCRRLFVTDEISDNKSDNLVYVILFSIYLLVYHFLIKDGVPIFIIMCIKT